jgi:hypothetical protein
MTSETSVDRLEGRKYSRASERECERERAGTSIATIDRQ